MAQVILYILECLMRTEADHPDQTSGSVALLDNNVLLAEAISSVTVDIKMTHDGPVETSRFVLVGALCFVSLGGCSIQR